MASIIQLKEEEEEENFESRVPDVGAVLLKFYEAPFLRGNKIRVATTSLLMTKKSSNASKVLIENPPQRKVLTDLRQIL